VQAGFSLYSDYQLCSLIIKKNIEVESQHERHVQTDGSTSMHASMIHACCALGHHDPAYIYACSQQQQLEKLQMDHGWMVITD